MKVKRLLSVLLCVLMVVALMPNTVLAEGTTPTRTGTLVITGTDEAIDRIADEGWSWEPSENGGTLTLNNFHLLVTELYQYESWTYNWGIRFEDFDNGSMIDIVLIGENSITSTVGGFGYGICVEEEYEGGSGPLIKAADITVSAEKDENDVEGSLSFDFITDDVTFLSPCAFVAKNLYIESGTINSNTDLCMVLYGVYISGGTINVQAKDMPCSSGIQSTRGPVSITGGDVYLNGAINGIIVPGNSTADDNNNLVSITGGNVTIIADNPGEEYFGFGISAPNIYINTDNYLSVYGEDIAVFSPTSPDGTNREVQILAVGEGSIFSNSEESIYNIVHVNDAGSTTSIPETTISTANYTAVDNAIEKANGLNKDYYVDFSGVETALAAVERDVLVIYQANVDAMATAIEEAIAALQYKAADYTKVEEAIAKAEALNPDDYTDFSAVEAAINAVVEGKNITEQDEVDAMATAIEEAIAALQYKAADYTKVEEAIAKAEALNPDDYIDFSAVEAAINAVVEGKNITEQDEVDAMAQAIEDAIAALEEKPVEPTQPTDPDQPEETPTNPEQPEETPPATDGNDSDTTPDTDTVPDTGADSSIILGVSMIVITVTTISAAAVYNRKRKFNR